MVDFFDYLYYLVFDKDGKVYSFFRFTIRTLANIIIPPYYKFTQRRHGLKNENSGFVVSLTSFPARINTLWLVIESLMRQTVKPDKIYLWLSKEQFESMDSLPVSLLNMQSRGLEIFLRDGDLRSHKKYLYMLREYPNVDFVIVDDDVIYNTHLLEMIVESHKHFPSSICCNLADIILNDKNEVRPYKYWNNNKPEYNKPQRKLLPIGVGGVYYPHGTMPSMTSDQKIFMDICPAADDLWLWATAYTHELNYIVTDNKFGYLPIIIKNNLRLASSNTTKEGKSGNDIQINNIIKFLTRKGVTSLKFEK